MKTNTTQVTKSHLLNYVTQFEFGEFRREVTERFDSVDTRLSTLDRKFEQLREDFRTHTGVLLQQSREEFKIAIEYMRHIEAKKLDKEEFETLEMRIRVLIG
jgi:AICAR transformylase/IMP cyclohydrolase PurH